jgi:hypothetical protein
MRKESRKRNKTKQVTRNIGRKEDKEKESIPRQVTEPENHLKNRNEKGDSK